MALGPAAGLDLRYDSAGRAAFSLALRICGDEAVAAGVVEQAFGDCAAVAQGPVGDGLVLRRVRDLACERRTRVAADPVAVSVPPAALAALAPAHWHVLDLVALHGATVREAATRLGRTECAVLALLRDGLQVARELLSGSAAREPDDHPDSARLALLR